MRAGNHDFMLQVLLRRRFQQTAAKRAEEYDGAHVG